MANTEVVYRRESGDSRIALSAEAGYSAEEVSSPGPSMTRPDYAKRAAEGLTPTIVGCMQHGASRPKRRYGRQKIRR